MATHLLTLKGNYIWLDDLDTGKRYEGLAKEVLIRSDLDDSTIFYFDGLNQFDKNIGIAFGEIDVNGNGAFGTLADWQDWYTANTGNFNWGGSAPSTLKYICRISGSGTNTPPSGSPIINTIEVTEWIYLSEGNYACKISDDFININSVIVRTGNALNVDQVPEPIFAYAFIQEGAQLPDGTYVGIVAISDNSLSSNESIVEIEIL